MEKSVIFGTERWTFTREISHNDWGMEEFDKVNGAQ
jgi:hypothetical protein